jgi:hypothetical protein
LTIISNNSSGLNFYYTLQLGTDENIYVVTSWSPFLGVIDNPTITGLGCNFIPNGVDLDPTFLGHTAALGLPAFVQSYFRGETVCAATGIGEPPVNEIKVNPTVSKDGFYLYAAGTKSPLTMEIIDGSGRLVRQQNNISGSGFYFGNDLPQGSFVVRIETASRVYHTRVIKL